MKRMSYATALSSFFLACLLRTPAHAQTSEPLPLSFARAITAINGQLGTITAVKAPPPFSDPANRAHYDAVRTAMEQFGTPAFPLDGMKSFEAVCAPLNEASVKHMFVGTAALKALGLSQAQLQQRLAVMMQQNAQTYQNETVTLVVANVRCMTAHLPFVADFAAGLKPEEFTEIRRSGLEKMGHGLANAVFGLATQPLVPGSTPANSQAAMDAAVRYAADAASVTTPAYRATILSKMDQIAGRYPAAYRPAFLKVHAAFETATCEKLCAKLRPTQAESGSRP